MSVSEQRSEFSSRFAVERIFDVGLSSISVMLSRIIPCFGWRIIGRMPCVLFLIHALFCILFVYIQIIQIGNLRMPLPTKMGKISLWRIENGRFFGHSKFMV